MIGQDGSTRLLSLFLVASIHIAVGWALIHSFIAGVPASERSKNDGPVLVVELLPANRSATGEPPPAAKRAANSRSQLPPLASRPAAEEPRLAGNAPRMPDLHAAEDGHGTTTRADLAALTIASLPSAEVAAYRNRLQTHLARYRLYPPSAQEQGSQGIVSLHFIMDRSGHVIDAWIEMSSGVTAIDREALEAVLRAQPLPALPLGWPDRLDISLPLTFRLG